MNADVLSEWFTRQKYRVLQTRTSFWVEFVPMIYQAYPFHWIISPTSDDFRELWHESGAAGIRYSSPLESENGKLSYHVIFPLDGEEFTLAGVRKKPRYDIRKGLKNFEITPISMRRFMIDGWSVRLETLARQKRTRAESQAWWERMCSSAEDLPGFEAWAAYSDGIMAASALVIQCDDYSYIYYQQSRTDCLRLGVNNSLAFAITTEMLSRPGMRKVFYGLQSLDARPSVDRFKFRMGFEAQPVRQTVLFHPYISRIVNPFSHSILQRIGKTKPGSAFSKAEGMFRFYLEGKKNIYDQDLPEILMGNLNGFFLNPNKESVLDGEV